MVYVRSHLSFLVLIIRCAGGVLIRRTGLGVTPFDTWASSIIPKIHTPVDPSDHLTMNVQHCTVRPTLLFT